jgi:hypothetical protein
MTYLWWGEVFTILGPVQNSRGGVRTLVGLNLYWYRHSRTLDAPFHAQSDGDALTCCERLGTWDNYDKFSYKVSRHTNCKSTSEPIKVAQFYNVQI